MNEEEKLKKAAIQKEAYDHYYHVFDKMFHWCMFDQPDNIDTMFMAFGIDKKATAMKACEDVMAKLRKADESISKRDK
jgi:hypothetical protein